MSSAISDKLLEVRDYIREGYNPVIDYGAWRVAILNFSNDLLPENITAMQRHDETDEVFVLLCGRCTLFIGEGDEKVKTVHAQDMQPFKIYNVKKSVWYTHTLSRNAKVLIVENRNTTFDNSPFSSLTVSQRAKITKLTSESRDEAAKSKNRSG